MMTTGERDVFVPAYLAVEPELPARMAADCRTLARMAADQGVDLAPLRELLNARIKREGAALDKICPHLAEAHLDCMMQSLGNLVLPVESL
jgi:hypothetical protein